MDSPFEPQRIPACGGRQPQGPLSASERALLARIEGEVPPGARAGLRIQASLRALRERLDPEPYGNSLEVITRVAEAAPELGRALVHFLPELLEMLPGEDALSALCLARRISHASGRAAYGFLSHLVRIHRALGKEGLEGWTEEGIRLLGRNAHAGEAFFSLASSSGRARAAVPDRTVLLGQVREVLRLFVQGLSGVPLQVHSTTDGLASEDAGLLGRVYPATDGLAVYLPPQADLYPTCEENALYYKILSAHQAGYFEAGTFAFSLFAFLRKAEGHALLRGWKPRVNLGRVDSSAEFLSPLQVFFTLFANPALMRTIFTLVEDGRVDAHLRRRYPGLAADMRFFVQDVLSRRPALKGMPLRDAFLEILLRLSLDPEAGLETAQEGGGAQALRMACKIREILLECFGPDSSVEDSALASTLLYGMLGRLLARAAASAEEAAQQEWRETDPCGELPALGPVPFLEAGPRSDLAEGSVESLELDELKFRIELRGATDLGATQKGLKAREAQPETASDSGNPGPWQSIPLEELKRLLEQGIRPALSLAPGDEGEQGLLFFFDGPRNPQALPPLRRILEDSDAARYRRIWTLRRESRNSFRTPGDRVFHYREWDCLIEDYRPDWCRLIERQARSGSATFVQDVLSVHGALLASLRKQFERLRPEQMRPERDLLDGEEIDLDRAVESLIDRRCGLPGRERLYRRRRKAERDVTTLFLLDMSSSTDERVKAQPFGPRQQDAARPHPAGGQADVLSQISWALAEARGAEGPEPILSRQPSSQAKRIIDIEKEALVLLAEALEPLGDRYGIFGFSGSGRLHVEFFTIKDFSEPYALPVKERLSGIEPRGSTRMGTALRHCKYRLRREQARRRNLILLSDGFPQDQDYGPRRAGHEYAVEDTARALAELEQEGTRTYCITVDRNGEDYLGRMCPKSRYMVIQDLAALPEALLMLYRKATDRVAAARP